MCPSISLQYPLVTKQVCSGSEIARFPRQNFKDRVGAELGKGISSGAWLVPLVIKCLLVRCREKLAPYFTCIGFVNQLTNRKKSKE